MLQIGPLSLQDARRKEQLARDNGQYEINKALICNSKPASLSRWKRSGRRLIESEYLKFKVENKVNAEYADHCFRPTARNPPACLSERWIKVSDVWDRADDFFFFIIHRTNFCTHGNKPC